jgi:electron transfer flavoprotein alpha subunit
MILVLVEPDQASAGGPAALPDLASAEALTLGRDLAHRLGVPLEAAVIGAASRHVAAGLGDRGVSVAHIAEDAALEPYAPAAWAACLASLVTQLGPRFVIAGGTTRGHEILAAAAARTGAPFAAGCVEIRAGEPLVVTRQRWAGSVLEDAEVHGSPAYLALAEHALEAHDPLAPVSVEVRTAEVALDPADLRTRLVERVPASPDRVSLADARVVVGGGRGVGGADGFAALDELASLLGGTVGVSRVVTSAGWRPHGDQVGQTGTRIAPDLYIACGISGAIQHIVGCRSAKAILAINTDPEAPIMARADYAVIGDLHAVVPAINAEIRRVRGA